MPIDKIYERIEREADEAVSGIIEKAGEEAARIGEDYSHKASLLADELGEYAGKKAAEEEKHLIVSEQLELRKAVLTKKREILAGIYGEAKKRIEAMPADQCADILRRMIIQKAVTGKETIIHASSQKSVFTSDFIKSLNSGFSGGGDFSISDEPGSFSWGVVLREGRRVVDLSLDVIFEQLKEKVEPEVAALLFPAE